jgi:hypothetical protein
VRSFSVRISKIGGERTQSLRAPAAMKSVSFEIPARNGRRMRRDTNRADEHPGRYVSCAVGNTHARIARRRNPLSFNETAQCGADFAIRFRCTGTTTMLRPYHTSLRRFWRRRSRSHYEGLAGAAALRGRHVSRAEERHGCAEPRGRCGVDTTNIKRLWIRICLRCVGKFPLWRRLASGRGTQA